MTHLTIDDVAEANDALDVMDENARRAAERDSKR
jgi:Family of unknown function (DUF6889)